MKTILRFAATIAIGTAMHVIGVIIDDAAGWDRFASLCAYCLYGMVIYARHLEGNPQPEGVE